MPSVGSMKQVVFSLPRASREEAIAHIKALPSNERFEVVIRTPKQSKTLEQLGALFGVWINYLSKQTGYEKNHLHRLCKAKCLARIYIMDPQTNEQEQWVELLAHYQQVQQQDNLIKHAKRISLSWATLDQMSKYMNDVEHYWLEEGYQLPLPDKLHSAYKKRV